MAALVIESLLGYLTLTASIMAFGKLQEIVPTRPMTYKGQNFVNLAAVRFRRVSGRLDDRRSRRRRGFSRHSPACRCSSASC